MYLCQNPHTNPITCTFLVFYGQKQPKARCPQSGLARLSGSYAYKNYYSSIKCIYNLLHTSEAKYTDQKFSSWMNFEKTLIFCTCVLEFPLYYVTIICTAVVLIRKGHS